MVLFRANLMWYVIHDELVKDIVLLFFDREQTKLQMYLIDNPPMRYDLNLF